MPPMNHGSTNHIILSREMLCSIPRKEGGSEGGLMSIIVKVKQIKAQPGGLWEQTKPHLSPSSATYYSLLVLGQVPTSG